MLEFSLKRRAAAASAVTRHTIACEAGEFEILCRPPTYADRLEDEALNLLFLAGRDSAAYAQQMERRLRACVVGWSGVRDGDSRDPEAELPYSPESLMQVCGQFPAAAVTLNGLLTELYRENPIALGESVGPRIVSGETSAPPATGTQP